jgi:hypothetical protein
VNFEKSFHRFIYPKASSEIIDSIESKKNPRPIFFIYFLVSLIEKVEPGSSIFVVIE